MEITKLQSINARVKTRLSQADILFKLLEKNKVTDFDSRMVIYREIEELYFENRVDLRDADKELAPSVANSTNSISKRGRPRKNV